MPRYFVSEFNGAIQWAYPLDFCTPSAATASQIVTCNTAGTIATVTSYSGTTCSGSGISVNVTSSSVTSTGLYAFNCNGTDDYLATEISVGSCTSPVITLTAYGVTNLCFGLQTTVVSNKTLFVYQKAQCNATHGIVDSYVSASSAYTSAYVCGTSYKVALSESFVNPTCQYYFTEGSFVIYAQAVDCVYNGYSQYPQKYDNSGDFTATSYKLAENYTISFEAAPSEAAITNNAPLDLCGDNWAQWFTAWFPGCKFYLTTQCTTYASDFDDTDLASIYVWATVSCYTTSSFTYKNCSTLDLSSQIANTNVTVNSLTCTSYKASTSVGHSQGIHFIVLAIGFFMMSLYIL